MAQKKRKRKHRGTPAGTIERHAHTTEKRRGTKPAPQTARERRVERLSQPPSWRSAFNRAAIASALFAILVIVAFGENPATGIFLALFVLPLYTVTGYYMDSFRYKRVMKRKTTEG
jgi:hypothetical protein